MPAETGATSTSTVAISRLDDDSFSAIGRRAWVRYRDLGVVAATGGRLGGTVVRSRRDDSTTTHTTGWHYHDCEHQLAFVLQGWTDLVLSDGGRVRTETGTFFSLPAGTVHNDVGSSPHLEVLEITAPAAIGTVAAADPLAAPVALPEGVLVTPPDDRQFVPIESLELDRRDLGLGLATAGRASAFVVRARPTGAALSLRTGDDGLELSDGSGVSVVYVIRGWCDVTGSGSVEERAETGACLTVQRSAGRLVACSADFEMLQIMVRLAAPGATT